MAHAKVPALTSGGFSEPRCSSARTASRKRETPALTGAPPSSGTSITITVSPDVLSAGWRLPVGRDGDRA